MIPAAGSKKIALAIRLEALQERVPHKLFWMAPQPVDVLFYTPLDVVLGPVADFFFDPGDIHVSIRSVSRVTPGLQTYLRIGNRRFHFVYTPPVCHR